MQPLRVLLNRHRLLALLLLACALMVKAAVPTGFMIERHGATLTIENCVDAPNGMVGQMAHALPGESMHGKAMASKAMDGKGGHNKTAGPCPYAALGMAPLAGTDAVLLDLALIFILAAGLTAVPSAPLRRISFLRPPLRGPPARA